ncbi:MAG: DUF1015 domain-containing protein [Candidatus Omnitrophica bacterium]|nr:DUF1015 domain-containing protein [Candidatus Omnitrophota bacterium]
MPLIEPFKGLRYDPKRVGSLSRVVTPPYDVISPEGQALYYRLHPYNFVRVVFGKGYRSDTQNRNRYSRARETLGNWIREGILKFDPEPSVYPYLQEYTMGGRRRRRWGVVALVRLDSPKIYPHEETREGPKLDRYRLLETVQASLSPIFGLIPDSQGGYQKFLIGACRNRKPAAVARIGGVKHTLWKNSDRVWHKKLKNRLRLKEIVIADGHHRFESALAYRNARRKKDPHFSPDAPYNYAMFYLAAAGTKEPGLLPTHRLVKRFPHGAIRKLEGVSQGVINLRVLENRLRRLTTQGKIGLGLYTGNGDRGAYLLKAPEGSAYRLDVEWLHQEILPRCAGPDPEVSYTQDLLFAREQLRRKEAQAIFLVQPPPLKEVFGRARLGSRMPGKTTYFHPKPLAGLVEYKF